MKCIISSVIYWDAKTFVNEYARTILKAGFELERSDDGRFYTTLYSLEDLKKLSEAVENDIIFELDGKYPTLTIYDDYME